MKNVTYKITNTENEKTYYGSSCRTGRTRWNEHKRELRMNKHENGHLQNSWNKWGSDAFEFEVISSFENKKQMLEAEQALIDEYYGDGCYNICEIAEHPPSWEGKKHTEESKRKIGKAGRGRVWSDESRLRMSETIRNKPKPTCPHCGLTAAANTMTRYHFDKCKMKGEQ